MILYICICLLAIFLAYILPSLDIVIVVLLAFTLSFICGFRLGGSDYENYTIMINEIHKMNDTNAEWSDVISAAKDPGIAYVIKIANLYNTSDTTVFILMALMGFMTKSAVAILVIPKNKTLFIALYALFLAPGLEFAAIRSAVGLGFLALSITSTAALRYKISLFLIAIFFHFSVILGGIFLFNPIKKLFFNNLFIGFLITVLAYLLWSNMAIYMNEWRKLDDLDKGTNLVFILPLCALVFQYTFSRQQFVFYNENKLNQYKSVISTAILFNLIAVTLSTSVAVISTRCLEISLFFNLMGIIISFSSKKKLNNLSIISAYTFFLFLAVINIYRGTWLIMFTDVFEY
ncbi:MAG: EpsG family protein [Methylococcales bacterium]